MKTSTFPSASGWGSYKQEASALLARYPDLRKARQKRLFKLFFKTFLVGVAILGLTGYLYYDTRQVALAVVGVALAVFALYKIADPRRNFKRRCGRVAEIQFFQTRVVNKNGFMNSYTAMMDAVLLVVWLESANGRRYKLELENRFQDVVRVGDVLIEMPGIPYFVNETSGDLIVCPFCGNMMPRKNKDCIGCGRPNIYAQN